MKAFFAPAFAILGRVGVGAATALIAALFLVPPAMLYFLAGAGAWADAAAMVSLAAALYLSAANAAWTRAGMARLSSCSGLRWPSAE